MLAGVRGGRLLNGEAPCAGETVQCESRSLTPERREALRRQRQGEEAAAKVNRVRPWEAGGRYRNRLCRGEGEQVVAEAQAWA